MTAPESGTVTENPPIGGFLRNFRRRLAVRTHQISTGYTAATEKIRAPSPAMTGKRILRGLRDALRVRRKGERAVIDRPGEPPRIVRST
jgi:hypothetical protein